MNLDKFNELFDALSEENAELDYVNGRRMINFVLNNPETLFPYTAPELYPFHQENFIAQIVDSMMEAVATLYY